MRSEAKIPVSLLRVQVQISERRQEAHESSTRGMCNLRNRPISLVQNGAVITLY